MRFSPTVCTSCIFSLLLFFSAKASLWATASRSGRYRASCLPPGRAGCLPFISIFVARISPLSQKMSSNNPSFLFHDSLVDQMLSPARTHLSVLRSISWFKHCPPGPSLIHMFAPMGRSFPKLRVNRAPLQGTARTCCFPKAGSS